jgi:hypothetical protein
MPSIPRDAAARQPRPIVLTHRDLALLDAVASLRSVPLSVVAEQFFAFDPVTGARNGKPEQACRRRLLILASAGYLWLTHVHDGSQQRHVVSLGPRASATTGTAAGRNRIPPNKRAHHVRTVDAIARLEAQLRTTGGRIVRVRMEHDLRREAQRGRMTERGEKLGTFPDAACTIEIGGRRLELAVEYVTSKYTSADIEKKRASFRGEYDGVAWFADRASTATRVERLTEERCTTLK